MAREFIPPETCTVCGEAVPRGAQACPGCGADERSGWNEEAARYDGLDLPDEAFDAGTESRPRYRSSSKFWLIVALILLVLFAGGMIFR